MKKMKRIDTAADAVAMGTEAPERQEEALRLRAALEKAEKARLFGAAAYTLKESRERLAAIYRPD